MSEQVGCRRCAECKGCEHHWLEELTYESWDADGDPVGEPIGDHVCKHCPAVGMTCEKCDGHSDLQGENEDGEDVVELCYDCKGLGVIVVPGVLADDEDAINELAADLGDAMIERLSDDLVKLRAENERLAAENQELRERLASTEGEREAALQCLIMESRAQRSDGIQHRWVDLFTVCGREFRDVQEAKSYALTLIQSKPAAVAAEEAD